MVRLRQQNSSFLLLEASRIKRKIDGNSYLIFAYEDRGKCYLEQPYQGIYKIDRKLFERLKEIE